MKEKIYLQVPYADKDFAKAEGAKWDKDRKQWYVINTVPDSLKDFLPAKKQGDYAR